MDVTGYWAYVNNVRTSMGLKPYDEPRNEVAVDANATETSEPKRFPTPPPEVVDDTRGSQWNPRTKTPEVDMEGDYSLNYDFNFASIKLISWNRHD